MPFLRENARVLIPIVVLLIIVGTFLAIVRRPDAEPGHDHAASGETAEGTWICPMHPQIRQPEPGDCPICGMDLVLVEEEVTAAASTWICPMHPQIQQPEPGDCPICGMDLVPIEGEIQDEGGERRLTVSEAGRRLMEIETALVERRHVEAEVEMVGRVAYDEGRVATISAWVDGRIDRLYASYEGAVVRRGDPMVDLYSPSLLAAQEELLQSKEAVARAEESGSGDWARATLGAVRERLRLWGLSDAQIREIETRGTAEPHVTITAPVGGTVVEKNVNEGSYVSTGMAIYTIADLSNVWIELDAYESDLAWIRLGQTVEIRVEAIPGGTTSGQISFIDPTVDPRTRTVKVRVEIPNTGGALKPDMFVRGVVSAVPHDHDRGPLVIPATAALVTGKRAVVYVEILGTDRPTYEGREVALGARAGDHYVVLSGLTAGERVVTEGAFKIDSALQIRAKPSMMSPEGNETPPVHEHGGH